jgi:ribosome biogenesis GTPase
MINSNKEFLSHFGWSAFFESDMPTTFLENLFIARVINEERNLYRLQVDMDKTILSSVPGKMKFEATGRQSYPSVGDWVLADIPDGSDRAVIRFIFKRKASYKEKK